MASSAKTTTTTTTNTVNRYNTNTSAADRYAPVYRTAVMDPVTLMDINSVASREGMGSDYIDENSLYNIYANGSKAALNQSLTGADVANNTYAQNMNKLNRSVIDAIRSETAGSIASGTSRAISDANVLKSILGLQQTSVADATTLAQQYKTAYDTYGTNLAKNTVDANSEIARRKEGLLTDALGIYQTDTTRAVEKYAADQALYGSMYTAEANRQAAAIQALLGQVLGSTTTSTAVENTAVPVVAATSTPTNNVNAVIAALNNSTGNGGTKYPALAATMTMLKQGVNPLSIVGGNGVKYLGTTARGSSK